MEGVQRHHMLWTRNEYTRPHERKTRQMGAFVLRVPTANHRLLHLSLEPPEKPSVGTLEDMRLIGRHGLEVVMRNLDDPIIEHFEQQLSILTLSEAVARTMLRNGERYGIS